jgi:hypothetical protein
MFLRRAVPWTIAILVFAAIFQLFFRYEYMHTTGNLVVRVDRLTGASCYLPCAKSAATTPGASGCTSVQVVRTYDDWVWDASAEPNSRFPTPFPANSMKWETLKWETFVELDDGHVYSVIDPSQADQAAAMKPGQIVTLCGVTSRINGKTLFYSLDEIAVSRTR